MAEWAFTVARNEVDCFRKTCLARKTEYCRQPSGKKALEPHSERMAQMSPAQWDRCRHV
jgi:hypothetical protein